MEGPPPGSPSRANDAPHRAQALPPGAVAQGREAKGAPGRGNGGRQPKHTAPAEEGTKSNNHPKRTPPGNFWPVPDRTVSAPLIPGPMFTSGTATAHAARATALAQAHESMQAPNAGQSKNAVAIQMQAQLIHGAMQAAIVQGAMFQSALMGKGAQLSNGQGPAWRPAYPSAQLVPPYAGSMPAAAPATGSHSGNSPIPAQEAADAAPAPPTRVPQRPAKQTSNGSERDGQPFYVGVLRTFSPKDGYGFIQCPALRKGFDRDIYIHKAELPEGASCGCSVSFRLHINAKGQPQARDVTLVVDSEGGCSYQGELLLDFAFESLHQEALSPAASKLQSQPVRICCWNILAAAYANCKAFPDVEPSFFAWPRRKSLIAAALARLDADVFCLQEVDRPLEDLGLQGYEHVRAQRPDSRADGCIIAWKRGDFVMERKEVICFDDYLPLGVEEEDKNAQKFRRGNCAVLAELKRKGERSFVVATAHLCWEAECEDVRQMQTQVLLAALEPHANRLGNRAILCGDLNAMPGCRSHGTITRAMASVYGDLEAAGCVTNSNASASAPVIVGSDRAAGSAPAEPATGFAGMLDYLCLNSSAVTPLSRLRLPAREELHAKLGGRDGPLPTLLCQTWPSDHLPVAADICFTFPGTSHWQ